jgi:hypothetical protein
MRIRTVKPEFWQNEDLGSLSFEARLLAIGLLNWADDEGYFQYNERVIKGQLFPFDDSLNIHGVLTELSCANYIAVYNGTDGKRYGHVVTFLKHQKINRPNESKIKHLCASVDDSLSTHGLISDSSLPEQGTGNREQVSGKGKEQGTTPRKRVTPTALDFSQWPRPLTTDELKAIKANRKGKQITQSIIDYSLREINAIIEKGYTLDDVLGEWIARGWQGISRKYFDDKKKTITDADTERWQAILDGGVQIKEINPQ